MLGNRMMQDEIDEMGYSQIVETDESVEYDFEQGIATISCSRFIQVWRIDAEGELLEQLF